MDCTGNITGVHKKDAKLLPESLFDRMNDLDTEKKILDLHMFDGASVCWNLIPDSLDQVESQMDSNAIYYFEVQTWNLALQPA